jgi:hypothetical protein
MSSRPSTKDIHEAFMATAWAIEYLTVVKQHLIEMHSASEEVDNSTFLVENHHRWAAPDADTHDVLFARLEKAKEALSQRYAGNETNLIRAQLEEAEAMLRKTKELL